MVQTEIDSARRKELQVDVDEVETLSFLPFEQEPQCNYTSEYFVTVAEKVNGKEVRFEDVEFGSHPDS